MAKKARKKIPMMLYLEPEQVEMLKKRARKERTPIAAVVRNAINAAFGVFPVELKGGNGVARITFKAVKA